MPTAVAIRQIPGKPGSVYYPLTHIPLTLPSLGPEDIEVSLHAAALNHRDLFIRQHLYPGTTFQVPLLADGYGTVVATGSSPSAQRWQGKRVVLNPGRGWKDDTEGPEGSYAILGGTKFWPSGTLAERIVLPAGEVEEAPGHLSAVEAAALPLTGLTAWRALVTKSRAAREGSTILVTGIGGGVALMVLGFAAAMGAKVFVTSGSEEKLRKAKDLGAQGGVSYKDEKWDGKLKGLLPEGSKGFDAVIDGAGGDVVDRAVKLLRPGGVIVSYGMTLGPKVSYSMGAVLKNIELRGSTMGSRKEFADMIRFVSEKKVVPVISRSIKGIHDLAAIDSLFEDMKNGSQFGKLVVEIEDSGDKSPKTSKI